MSGGGDGERTRLRIEIDESFADRSFNLNRTVKLSS
jgi:hypothetical protein